MGSLAGSQLPISEVHGSSRLLEQCTANVSSQFPGEGAKSKSVPATVASSKATFLCALLSRVTRHVRSLLSGKRNPLEFNPDGLQPDVMHKALKVTCSPRVRPAS